MPYLLDGEIKVTQAVAIMRYLGRKFDLMPSEADMTKAEMFEQYLQEFRNAMSDVIYSRSVDELEKKKSDFLTELSVRVEEVGRFIKTGPYALGEKITYVDFLALEFLDQISVFSPDHFKSGPVADYIKTMKSLPPLKRFYESDTCTHEHYSVTSPMGYLPGRPIEKVGAKGKPVDRHLL